MKDITDVGIFDLKSKQILPRSVKRRGICVCINKNQYCVLWKKNKRDKLLNGVEETKTNSNYVENKINEKNLSQRIRYRLPKHETLDQLENVFVFDLETYNDQKLAEAHAARLYDVYRLRDQWNRDLTLDEILTEKGNVIVFDGCDGNPVMSMLKKFSKDYEGDKRTYIKRDGDELVSSYRPLLIVHNAKDFDS